MNAENLAWNIAAHWIQSGVIAGSSLIALRLLAVTEARARLAALHVTLATIVVLPVLQPWRSQTIQPPAAASVTSAHITVGVSEPGIGDIGAFSSLDPTVGMLVLVAAGAATRMLWLGYGIVGLVRFRRRALRVDKPGIAADLEALLAVSPSYVQQDERRTPWTFGLLRPTVALPAGFDALNPDFQRAVVCHELVHVQRRDVAVAFVEELAAAVLWFHPWVWLLRARMRVAREKVVDARVVEMLENRDEYVRCLVEMSGHDLAPHFSHAGAGMLRPRELRARVDAIFENAHMSRMRIAVAAVTFAIVTIATGFVAVAAVPLRAPASSMFLAAEPSAKVSWSRASAQRAPDASRKQINKVYPEYPQDAMERGIQGTVMVDIVVNAAGDVSTASVASGPQELRASAFKAAVALKYTPASSPTAMKITFEYSLTGTSWGVRINGAPPTIATKFFTAQASPVEPDTSRAYRVGNGMRPPKKIKDTPPEYPAIARESRVQGVVILEARIDERGMVSDVRPLRSIPLLDQAAIESVRQWQYEPTLLNGVPVPVIMTVTVNFSLRELFQIELVMPDGKITTSELQSGGMLQMPGFRLHFRSRSGGTDDPTVSVLIDDGQTHLGEVVLALNGPVVQTPTTPSVGLRLTGIR
jgi:TonB family protein